MCVIVDAGRVLGDRECGNDPREEHRDAAIPYKLATARDRAALGLILRCSLSDRAAVPFPKHPMGLSRLRARAAWIEEPRPSGSGNPSQPVTAS